MVTVILHGKIGPTMLIAVIGGIYCVLQLLKGVA